MKTLLENNTNKLIERFLEVENISFKEDICDIDDYYGKHIKRGGSYRKEEQIKYSFPKYISCVFTKNGERLGIKFPTKDFIVNEDYQYNKNDVVDVGDGLIYIEGNGKPLLLSYMFIGTKYRLDTNKVVKYLKEKIPPNF